MFGDQPFPEDRFAPAFLQQVPYERVKQIIAEIKGAIGPLSMVQALGGPEYLVVTATHDLPVTIMVDANNDIAGLLFKPAVDRNASQEGLLAALDTGVPYAYLVTKNGETLYAHEADTKLAIGSAFKLGILSVLKDQIAAGERAWSDVVTLEAGHISLPSGMLQDWPVGSPLTLQTLASLMISVSDNTATDALLATVGREAVEAKLGQPVLSTRELFQLKADASLRARWIGGDADEKRAVSAALAGRDLPAPWRCPDRTQLGAEWYLSATALCALIEEVGGLDVMQINPGVAQPRRLERDRVQGRQRGGRAEPHLPGGQGRRDLLRHGDLEWCRGAQ